MGRALDPPSRTLPSAYRASDPATYPPNHSFPTERPHHCTPQRHTQQSRVARRKPSTLASLIGMGYSMTSTNSWRARRASPWPLPSPTCVCVHMLLADRRLPHLCRDWSDLSTSVLGLVSPCHICAGARLTLSTSVPGLGARLPHLHRECAHLATSAPGLGAAPSPATTWGPCIAVARRSTQRRC